MHELTKIKQENMQKHGIDVKRAASLSVAKLGSVSNEQEVSYQKEMIETFDKAVVNKECVTIGSKPPTDGGLFFYAIHMAFEIAQLLTYSK